jgi:hypothetical protein
MPGPGPGTLRPGPAETRSVIEELIEQRKNLDSAQIRDHVGDYSECIDMFFVQNKGPPQLLFALKVRAQNSD